MSPVLFWTICSSAVLVSTELLKLDFTKAPVEEGPLTHRTLELPMYNDIFHQKYTVNVTVGNPPQPATLLIDTGSADFWLPAPDSLGCSPTCPPGSFDTTKSSSFQATNDTFIAEYGLTPGNEIRGHYFRDTLAVANVPKTFYDDGFYGIIGLGSRLAESIYRGRGQPGFGKENATFPTLYDQLQAHGYTAMRAFSIWQNTITATTGRLIFGGIDTTKYHGELISVPVQLSDGQFLDWAVPLTSVTRESADQRHSKEVLTAPNASITVILDSGSPNMYLPWTLYHEISSAMNATEHLGFPYVPCAERKVPSSLEFGFGGTSGPKIRVPYSELLYPFGAPSNIGPVIASDGTPLCYLGVNGTDSMINLLGDTFIRSAYLVYDVDNLRVLMAQARYDADEEHIVEIPAGIGLPGCE